MTKRRSDITKLISSSREIWRQSEVYQAVKRGRRLAGNPGWFDCEECGKEVEVIRIDHIFPIGKQPSIKEDFGWWLPKLFCGEDNLQGLCNACHKIKTKKERKKKKSLE